LQKTENLDTSAINEETAGNQNVEKVANTEPVNQENSGDNSGATKEGLESVVVQ